MKISMFSSWQVRCGIANYTAELVKALQNLENTQILVVPFDRNPHPRADYVRWGDQMNEGDVAHIQHEYTFFGYLLPWRNYFHAFASQIRKPLVITKHVSFDGPLILTERGLGRFIRQTKWALYNRWLGPYATYLNRDMFDVAQHIIVLSTHMKEQLVLRGICPDKIHVILPGVPRVPLATGGEPLRMQWGWSEKRIVGMFGYITPAKGHTIALQALAHLPEEYTLLIAGGLRRESDRPALEAIERESRKLNLQSRVRITGYLDEADIPAHLDACDVLVYPYTRVDTSYSVMVGLGYQAAPMIISDVAAHRELAEHDAGVTLFRSGDAVDLAHTITDLLCNEARRKMLLEKARRFVHQNSWEVIAQQTYEVYRQMLPTSYQRT